MDGSPWQVLRDLQAWQITQIPRRPHTRQEHPADQDQADRSTSQRLRALVSAVGARVTDQDWEQCLADALTAFGECRWPRDHLPSAAAVSR